MNASLNRPSPLAASARKFKVQMCIRDRRPLDDATVCAKFMELAVPVIGSNAERLKQLVLGLDSTVAAKEILELCTAYQD